MFDWIHFYRTNLYPILFGSSCLSLSLHLSLSLTLFFSIRNTSQGTRKVFHKNGSDDGNKLRSESLVNKFLLLSFPLLARDSCLSLSFPLSARDSCLSLFFPFLLFIKKDFSTYKNVYYCSAYLLQYKVTELYTFNSIPFPSKLLQILMLLHLMLTQGFDEEGMKNWEREGMKNREREREREKEKMHTRQLEHSVSNRKLSKMCEWWRKVWKRENLPEWFQRKKSIFPRLFSSNVWYPNVYISSKESILYDNPCK